MKRKLPFPVRKRYKEGMRTCVILMVILLIITVGVNLLANYVVRQKPDTASFVRYDEFQGFSVPYYKCPVEIELNIIGGGNATIYLVKGDLIRHSERNFTLRNDPKYAEYIDSHKISWKENTRSYSFEGDLDKGDYTLLVFRIQERKDDSKPLIVGIDVEEGSDIDPGATEYTSSSKVVYERLNIFILKPLIPFVWILFFVGELLLVLWFFLFVRKWKSEKKYAGVQHPTSRTKTASRESPVRARPSWETDQGHGARKDTRRSSSGKFNAAEKRAYHTGKHLSSSDHHTQKMKQEKRDASLHASHSQHLVGGSARSAPEPISMVKVGGSTRSAPEPISMVKVGGSTRSAPESIRTVKVGGASQSVPESIPMVKVGGEKDVTASSVEIRKATVMGAQESALTPSAEESPAPIPRVPVETKETVKAVMEKKSSDRTSEIAGKDREIMLDEVTSIDQLMEDITVERRGRKTGRSRSPGRASMLKGRPPESKGIAERRIMKERTGMTGDGLMEKKNDDWRKTDIDTTVKSKFSSKRRERLESTFNSILMKDSTKTSTTTKRSESKDVLRNRMDDLLTMVLK